MNRHREVVVAIFNFGLRAEQRSRWELSENPAAGSPERREDEPARLEVFTVEQVEALARAAEGGAWRTTRPYETPTAEEALRLEDRQLADLLRLAAYTGLRRGELVALRWRDVRWSERVLVAERALSGTVERTTKGRRVRYVTGGKSRPPCQPVEHRRHVSPPVHLRVVQSTPPRTVSSPRDTTW